MTNKMQCIVVLLAVLVSLEGCATLTDEEREQIEYDLNEARAVYDERSAWSIADLTLSPVQDSGNVRYGSLAALFGKFSLMAASQGKAAVPD